MGSDGLLGIVQFDVVVDVCSAGLSLGIAEARMNKAVELSSRRDIDDHAVGAWLA